MNRFAGVEVPPLPSKASQPHKAFEHIANPNVLVAHTNTGIQVLALGSGTAITSLPLREHVAHFDVDGDGIIDNILVLENDAAIKTMNNFASSGQEFQRCTMIVTSGVPPTSQLFNGSLCSYGHSLHEPLSKRKLEVPASITAKVVVIRAIDEKTLMESNSRDVVIATSNGVVSCFGGNGKFKWQLRNGPTWTDSKRASVMLFDSDAMKVHDVGSHDTLSAHVLIVGDTKLAILSHDGEVLIEVEVGKASIAKPVIGDFDSDGVTDVIISTDGGIFGYRLEVVESTRGWLLVVVGVGLVAVVIFIANVQFEERLSSTGENVNRVYSLIRSTDNLHVD